MRRIVLYIAASIDGYIARRDGGLEWLTEYPNPDKTDYGYGEFYDSVDTIIMGGSTFRTVRDMDGGWPYADKLSYVVTRHPEASAGNIRFISENAVEEISALKKGAGKDIWLEGGGEIVSLLLAHNLIDEMIITTVPVLLGDGIRLFPEIPENSEWETISTSRFKSGMIQTVYKIIVKPEH